MAETTVTQSENGDGAPQEGPPRVVVGVDGSPGSRAALGLAFEEARARGARLEAVATWYVPAIAWGAGYVPLIADPGSLADAATEQLEKTVTEVLGEHASEIRLVVTEGEPVPVLLERAEGAALLVVGSRGLGGFKGLALGSVSQQLSHHVRCPLLIVPSPPHLVPKVDRSSHNPTKTLPVGEA